MSVTVGIDLGATKTAIGLVDSAGHVVQVERILTHADQGYEQSLERIAEVIASFPKSYQSIGLGIAGQIDPQSGILLFGPNLRWRNVPIQSFFEKKFSLPVHIMQDVRAAALAEWKYGAGKGCENFVCLFIGTGIGGGVVAEGKLLDGSSHTAGELGHMIIEREGPPCTCGSRGCLEALASGWAIAKQAEPEVLSAKEIAEAARKGDAKAKKIIENATQAIVTACISITNIFNPERIIIGGGVPPGLPDLLPRIREGIRHSALPAAQKKLQVLPALLGAEANLIGAAFGNLNEPQE